MLSIRKFGGAAKQIAGRLGERTQRHQRGRALASDLEKLAAILPRLMMRSGAGRVGLGVVAAVVVTLRSPRSSPPRSRQGSMREDLGFRQSRNWSRSMRLPGRRRGGPSPFFVSRSSLRLFRRAGRTSPKPGCLAGGAQRSAAGCLSEAGSVPAGFVRSCLNRRSPTAGGSPIARLRRRGSQGCATRASSTPLICGPPSKGFLAAAQGNEWTLPRWMEDDPLDPMFRVWFGTYGADD